MKHLPQKILAVLIIILLFLVGFTYYIQKPIPTFKRLIGKDIAANIKDIKLDRYDTKQHPVIFKIVPKNGKYEQLFTNITNACKAEKIEPAQVPNNLNKIDKKLVKTVKKSKQIFLSKANSNKSCLIFTQDREIFLYINDKF